MRLLTILFSSFLAVALFQIVLVVLSISGVSIPSHIFIGLSYSNLIGTFNDFALFAGLIAILSLFAIEVLRPKLLFKIFLYITLVSSFFILALANFFMAWVIVGVFTLLIFVYLTSLSGVSKEDNDSSTERTLHGTSFVVVLISLLFILGNSVFGTYLPSKLGIQSIDVRPSLSATVQVAKDVISENPLLGSGPNRFLESWAAYKPQEVNQTVFWSVPFSSGSGFVPSLVVTTGILGGLAILIFIIGLLVEGIQIALSRFSDPLHGFALFSVFLSVLYLWTFLFIYVPGPFIIFLTFIMTGVFFGTLVFSKGVPTIEFSFLRDPRASFFSILLIVVLIIATVSVGYIYAKKYSAQVFFSKSIENIKDTSGQNILLEKAEKNLVRALKSGKNDFQFRLLTDVYMARLQYFISNEEAMSSFSEEERNQQLQELVSVIEETSLSSVRADSTNYLNWISLGNAYSSFAVIGVSDALPNSISAFSRAFELSPSDPSIALSLASLSYRVGDKENALEFLLLAKNLKPDLEGIKEIESAINRNNSIIEENNPEINLEETTENILP